MATEMAKIEQVVIEGDLARLTEQERLEYYGRVCASLGLNPLTKPFAYIKLNGKLTLYALKDCTEQLARIHGISLSLSEGRELQGVYVVNCVASTTERQVEASGVVSIEGLRGEAMANALMRAETKASRRAVLRLVGLGMLDETETGFAGPQSVNRDTGEILDAPPRSQALRRKKAAPKGGAPSSRTAASQASSAPANPFSTEERAMMVSDVIYQFGETGRTEEQVREMARRQYGVAIEEMPDKQLKGLRDLAKKARADAEQGSE